MFMKFLKDKGHYGKTKWKMGASSRLSWILPWLSMALFFLLGLSWFAQAEAETFAYVTTGNDIDDGAVTVQVIRISDNTVVTTLGVVSPNDVAIAPNGAFVYVTSRVGDESAGEPLGYVSVFRTSSWSSEAVISVGSSARSVAITPDGAFAYVVVGSERSGAVSVIRTSDNRVVAMVGVGRSPSGIAITPDGAFAYVITENGVSVIRTSDNRVITTLNIGSDLYGEIAITPDGAFAYVTTGNDVSVIRTSDNSVATTVNVGSSPYGVAITPNGALAYVTTDNGVSVIRTSDNRVATMVNVGSSPYGVAITPDGAFAYVATDNGVSVIRTSDNSVATTVNVGPSRRIAIGPMPSLDGVPVITDLSVTPGSVLQGGKITIRATGQIK